VIEPEPEAVARYNPIFRDVYQGIYEAIRPFNHRFFDLFTGTELLQ
jgi:hypothetical protein